MRDDKKESLWVNHSIIGYTPLDEQGKPYRPALGRYHWKRKKPVTIYTTMNKAVQYSPVDSAAEVRMFEPMEVDGKVVVE